MRLRSFALLLFLGFSASALAAPNLLNHQGRMAVNGVLFEGTGQFKFALVNGDGSVTYWSNDGTSAAGSQPAAGVALAVTKGLYSVLLGDATLAGMTALPANVFAGNDVRLRVWFNDGTNGFQQITPDVRLAAAPYSGSSSSGPVQLSDVVAPPVKPVVAWGANSGGQTTVPALLSGANTAAIAAAGGVSLALLKDGTVSQWGSGAAVPAGLSGVTQIAAGLQHRLARKSDGTVTAWGDNTYGQANVSAITDAIAVAAGEKHSLVLRNGGIVTAFGDDTFTQATPPSLTGVLAIACGYDHCLALLSDGTVTAWGRNDTGQTDVPPGLTGVLSIAAGAYHSLAVKSDGCVVAWGWNTGGQCNVPPGLTGVAKVCGGYASTLALKSDGTLLAWGDNTGSVQTIPAEAVQVTAIASGASHCLALRADSLPAQVARLDQPNVFTGKVGLRRNPAANVLEVEGNASKSTAGSWLANSDRRIKTDIQPLTGALARLDQVRLVEFRYTPDYLTAHPGTEDRRYLNVIAQEFQRVFPEHVKSSGEKMPDGSDILQVDTYPLTIYSAAAVQELHRENQMLKQKLADQEERLRKLEEALRK